jgi:hypothetical protein
MEKIKVGFDSISFGRIIKKIVETVYKYGFDNSGAAIFIIFNVL